MAKDRAIVEEQYRGTANLEARIALHERFSTNRIGLPRWLFAQIGPAGAGAYPRGRVRGWHVLEHEPRPHPAQLADHPH